MKCLCAGALILFCAVVAGAQAPNHDSKADRSMIIALENAWNQAQIHHDGEALNRLVTDMFVYTDWDGTVLNKAKFISDSKDPATEMSLVANDDVHVYFYPGVAIVTGAYHAKGTSQGKAFDHYGRFTDTWIPSDGQWRCVASHTNLTRKPGAH
jgi:ketosteroid isomerase-like protein